jgi:hypothetical protein
MMTGKNASARSAKALNAAWDVPPTSCSCSEKHEPGVSGSHIFFGGRQKPIITTIARMFQATDTIVRMYRNQHCHVFADWPIRRRRKMATDILPVVVLTTEKLGAITVYFVALTWSSTLAISSVCIPRPYETATCARDEQTSALACAIISPPVQNKKAVSKFRTNDRAMKKSSHPGRRVRNNLVYRRNPTTIIDTLPSDHEAAEILADWSATMIEACSECRHEQRLQPSGYMGFADNYCGTAALQR